MQHDGPASSDFTLSVTEKVRRGSIQKIGSLADCLDVFVTITSPRLRRQCYWFIVPLQKVVPGQQSGPFWLENQLGRSQGLCEVSCIGSFAAGLSKHRGQWQQRRW
jgi:hypothetical protein